MVRLLFLLGYASFSRTASGTILTASGSTSCRQLFAAKPEALTQWPPPHSIPPELHDRFTMNGTADVKKWIRDIRQNGGKGQVWPVATVNSVIRECRSLSNNRKPLRFATTANRSCVCYASNVCWQAIAEFRDDIAGTHALVFGSQSPWAESMLLAVRASRVTTIEYANTSLKHANNREQGHNSLTRRWEWMHPTSVAQRYLDGSWQPADVAFSYSSLEHDGLGRYGDPINPEGDLQSVAKVACLLKPGGLFFWGAPVGVDGIVWNAHRIYGSKRLRLILRGWRLVTFFGTADTWDDKSPPRYPAQPVFVLQKLSE